MASDGEDRRIILDACFLINDSHDAENLVKLRKCGCRIVMIDTLPYEICTSGDPNDWRHGQKQLMYCHDAVEVWQHIGELLRWEVQNGTPIPGPCDCEATDRTRKWFKSRQVFVPDDLAELAATYVAQREEASVNALLSDCESLKGTLASLSAQIHGKPYEQTYSICEQFVNNEDNIRATLVRNHGDPLDAETYIPDPAVTVTPEWLAYHHAKCCLALLCLYIHKYGVKKSPKKIGPIENTVLDTDYLTLLAFGDGIATDETRDMARLCRWMYGDSRRVITTRIAQAIDVRFEEIQLLAYDKWIRRCREHGRDLDDWLSAEKQLYRASLESQFAPVSALEQTHK